MLDVIARLLSSIVYHASVPAIALRMIAGGPRLGYSK